MELGHAIDQQKWEVLASIKKMIPEEQNNVMKRISAAEATDQEHDYLSKFEWKKQVSLKYGSVYTEYKYDNRL